MTINSYLSSSNEVAMMRRDRRVMRRFPFHVTAGFTLVELLLVITIIGILAAFGATNFARTQRTARDTTRRTQVKAISDAMEQYYALHGSYANGCDSSSLATYLPGGMPTDPSGTANGLTCTVTGGGTGFCAAAVLENDDTGNCDSNCNPVVGGPVFCTKNLQ